MSDRKFDPALVKEVHRRMRWLTYKEHKYFHQDYTNLSGDQIAEMVPIATQMELESGGVTHLQLLDFRESYATKEAINALQDAAKLTEIEYEKTAVLGITGVKKIFLHIINKVSTIAAKPFKDEKEAKEWLIS